MAESAKRYNSVLDIIDKRLIPDEEAKKLRGEVFTPLNLVREMLFGIRKSASNKSETEIWGIDSDGNFFDDDEKDKVGGIPLEIWRDPETKWLDPANGIGNFPVVAFYMLDYQIGKHGPPEFKGDDNRVKRRRHIIKNMLFMIELNKGNVNTSRKIFEKILPGVTANICCANTLEMTDEKLKREFGVNRFHVIMGNPPFNRGGINRPDTRKNKSSYTGENKEKKETIWNKFVLQSFKFLKSNGFLLFIHPIGWFHSGDYDDVRNILLTNQLSDIRIYHKSQSVSMFRGSGEISVAYYCLQNKPSTKPTRVIGMNGHEEMVTLQLKSILLLNNSSIINKIINISPFWKDNKNFKHTSNICEPGSNKQIKGIYDDGHIHIVKVLKKHIDQNAPKIVLSGATYPRIYYDKKGEYGLIGSGVNYWIGDEKELNLLHSFLNTKLAAFLTKELRFRQGFVEFKYFPDINNLGLERINDKLLAEKFNFTSDEEKIINASEYPKREYTFKEVACDEKPSVPCLPPKEINPKTGNCVEPCKPPKTRNHVTGRCVNPPRATGKKGKAAAKPRRVTRKIRRT